VENDGPILLQRGREGDLDPLPSRHPQVVAWARAEGFVPGEWRCGLASGHPIAGVLWGEGAQSHKLSGCHRRACLTTPVTCSSLFLGGTLRCAPGPWPRLVAHRHGPPGLAALHRLEAAPERVEGLQPAGASAAASPTQRWQALPQGRAAESIHDGRAWCRGNACRSGVVGLTAQARTEPAASHFLADWLARAGICAGYDRFAWGVSHCFGRLRALPACARATAGASGSAAADSPALDEWGACCLGKCWPDSPAWVF